MKKIGNKINQILWVVQTWKPSKLKEKLKKNGKDSIKY